MTCPICGRLYCDHSPEERGQSHEEMLEDMQAPHVADGTGTRRVTREEYKRITGQDWPSNRGKNDRKN